MAVDEAQLRSKLPRAFAALNLRLLDVENVQTAEEDEDVEEVDEHLAANVKEWEAGAFFCWGTLHCYLGVEGEA